MTESSTRCTPSYHLIGWVSRCRCGEGWPSFNCFAGRTAFSLQKTPTLAPLLRELSGLFRITKGGAHFFHTGLSIGSRPYSGSWVTKCLRDELRWRRSEATETWIHAVAAEATLSRLEEVYSLNIGSFKNASFFSKSLLQYE